MQNRSDRLRPVAIWLFAMCALIGLMVIVGGATRLTDSGLSIVEWRPITGAVPPLNDDDWLAEFGKYKSIPEYSEVNWGMSIEEFKQIYWWEWGHRFLGRLIGLAFLLPLFYFAATRRIDRSLGVRLAGLFILGGAQGALGWWMVSSGLTERVDVSQYRLAAHLALAVLLFAAILWLGFDQWSVKKAATNPPPLGDVGTRASEFRVRVLSPIVGDPHPALCATFSNREKEKVSRLAPFAVALAAGVYLQMILGAFVAGLRAGRTFNTWPLMDGKFIPDGYFAGAPGFNDLFETAAASQFNHRLGAYGLVAATVWFFALARRTALKDRAQILLAAVALQIALGVWTVVAATPIALGLAHQAGALIILASALYLAHGSINSMSMTGASSAAGEGLRGSTLSPSGS